MSSESNSSDVTGRSDAGKPTPVDARAPHVAETERSTTRSPSSRDVRVTTLQAEIDLLRQERDALETERADLEREVARLGRTVADRERRLQRAIDRYERVTGEAYPSKVDEPTPDEPTPENTEVAATDGGRESVSTHRGIVGRVVDWLRRRIRVRGD